jgi:hypothetical protein
MEMQGRLIRTGVTMKVNKGQGLIKNQKPEELILKYGKASE